MSEGNRPPTGTRPSTIAVRPQTAPAAAQPNAPLDPEVRPGTSSLPAASQKAQQLGKNLVAALYMLVRSVKLYDPENAIFEKPLGQLLETCDAIVARDGKLDLAVVEKNFYVNGQMVRVDGSSLESLKYLSDEMEARQVGGFALQRPTSIPELRNFLAVFSKDQSAGAGEDGLEGKKLVSMKLTRWKKIQEKLNSEADGKVDRKKYAMTVYARTVLIAEALVAAYREPKPLPVDQALRQVQELVDLMQSQRTQFLGMTCTGEGERAFTHHLVNTALIAVAFGSELGLTRVQLRELGYAALLVDLPLCAVPSELRFALEPEKLPREIVVELVKARREGHKVALAGGAAAHIQQVQAAVAAEAVANFGKATRDARGRIALILPQSDPMQLSRITAIARYFDLLTSSVPGREAYGAEVALDVMWMQQRFRFDPELLSAFVKVMASQPVKLMDGKQGKTVELGG